MFSDDARQQNQPGDDSSQELIIGEGVRIEGAIHAPGRVEVFGTVEGDLLGDTVVVGKTGVIEGSLNANTADIYGTVSEDTEVADFVTLRESSSLTGELRYRSVEIEGGARLSATLKLLEDDVETLAHRGPARTLKDKGRTSDSDSLLGSPPEVEESAEKDDAPDPVPEP